MKMSKIVKTVACAVVLGLIPINLLGIITVTNETNTKVMLFSKDGEKWYFLDNLSIFDPKNCYNTVSGIIAPKEKRIIYADQCKACRRSAGGTECTPLNKDMHSLDTIADVYHENAWEKTGFKIRKIDANTFDIVP